MRVIDNEGGARHRLAGAQSDGEDAPGRARAVIGVLLALAVLHLAVLFRDNASATLVILLFVCVVPGELLLRACGLDATRGARRLVYAVTASLALFTAGALLVNTALPPVGLTRPLAAGPLLLSVDLAVLVLAAVALARGRSLRLPALPAGRDLAPAALLLVPLGVAAGVQLLDNGGGPWLVVSALTLAGLAVVGTALALPRLGAPLGAWVLYAGTLSLLWSYSLRGPGLYGFDVQQEFGVFQVTQAGQVWHPVAGDAYHAMLSITVLPTSFAELTGVPAAYVFKLVYPVLFALFPVGVYVLAQRWLRPRTAFACAAVIVLQAQFAGQLPALARQEIGLLLFLALVVVAWDAALPRVPRQVLAAVLGSALIVSHYSTAYVTVAALLGVALAGGLVRALARLRHHGTTRPVLSPIVIAWLVAFTVIWNAGVTDSTSNVSSFASTLSRDGAQVLPNGGGKSIVQAWFTGNVIAQVPTDQYFDQTAEKYETSRPWLVPYSPGVQAQFPAVDSRPSTVPGLFPGLRGPLAGATALVRQATNFGLVLGTFLFLVALRRRRAELDFALLAVGFLLVTVVVRVSGSFSFAYNPERLALQTSVVLVMGLGFLAQAAVQRWRRSAGIAGLALAGALTVAFLDASGLSTVVGGGNAAGNIGRSGEYFERYYVTAEDRAAARWMGGHHRSDAIIYSDRYGHLPLLAYSGMQRGLFQDLTPVSLDQRAYVVATSTNVAQDRARGSTGYSFCTYEFPDEFLDRYKAVVYATGSAEVYY